MWELNFFALLGMTQLVVPHMRERRSGTIVNVGSIGGKMTLPWLTLYSASKYAVGSLTEGMRMELRRDGVHAMLVCPGYVQTPSSRTSFGGESAGGHSAVAQIRHHARAMRHRRFAAESSGTRGRSWRPRPAGFWSRCTGFSRAQAQRRMAACWSRYEPEAEAHARHLSGRLHGFGQVDGRTPSGASDRLELLRHRCTRSRPPKR